MADIERARRGRGARDAVRVARRVFVIEAADTMNDQAANRMLKTLEEPPPFVHLLLLTERREDVLPTIASRCQHVRFDPLPPERDRRAASRAWRASGRWPARGWPQGDAGLAARLAGEEGGRCASRARGASCAGALAGATEERAVAGAAGGRQGRGRRGPGRRPRSALQRASSSCCPRKRAQTPRTRGAEGRRRGERRARTETLDLGLRLAELWLRDLLCLCEGAPELVLAVDRRERAAPRTPTGARAPASRPARSSWWATPA